MTVMDIPSSELLKLDQGRRDLTGDLQWGILGSGGTPNLVYPGNQRTHCYVRFPDGQDETTGVQKYKPAVLVRAGIGAVFLADPNRRVWVGKDPYGVAEIQRGDWLDLIQVGVLPAATNPLQLNNHPSGTPDNYVPLSSHPVGTVNNPSMLVHVFNAVLDNGEKVIYYGGTQTPAAMVNLTSSSPAAGKWRYAALWATIDFDAATVDLDVTTSTATDITSASPNNSEVAAALTECSDARPAGSIGIKAYYLADAQTALTDHRRHIDLRQMINMPPAGGTTELTVRLATAAALPSCTYANGSSGIGATLTATANGALSVDSVAVAASDRILVKDQASGLQNGIYVVTAAGSGGTPFVLTRDTGSDTSAEILNTVVFVHFGTVNTRTWYSCTNTSAITVGTTAITFAAGTGGGTTLPVDDTTAIVKGSADATKLLRFEVDGFTTGTTRVMTPPDYDGTLATLAGAETLTNKTLTAPKIDQINDSNGNEEVIFVATASAVNELTVTNAAVNGNPKIEATGSDTNIGIDIVPKGTDPVRIDGAVTINEAGTDRDFRVESDTDPNNIFSDGGNNNVGLGTASPDTSAKVEITSITKGLLIPRMTTTQRDAISTPATSLLIYNTNTGLFNFYNSGWRSIAENLLTTKGDLLTYTTTYDRLAVGANEYSPVADSTELAGIKWAQRLARRYRDHSGFLLRRLDNATLYVTPGMVEVNGTLVEKTTLTKLGMATGADWIGGASNEAASETVWVYVDASANVKLHNVGPNLPTPAAAVFTGQINGSPGLNGTSIVYDGDTGEGSVTEGMLLLVYTDSAYTTGRGRGTGAGGSRNNISAALITAINTGTNTITVEAGHNINLTDNDYIMAVPFGAFIYRTVSGTTYRFLGAMYNNASSNLEDNRQHDHAYYVANEGANYTIASATFADVDGTNWVHTVLSDTGLIEAAFDGDVNHGGAGLIYFDLDIDGIRYAGDDGAHMVTASPNSSVFSVKLQRLIPVLFGTHTVKLQWKRVTAGTATLYAGAGTANADVHPQFSIKNVRRN